MGTAHIQIYQALVREHAPAFTSPLTWYANGKRGHLHAYGSCSKLRRHGVITITLGLRDAFADRTVCTECLNYGNLDSEQRETFALARTLIDTSRRGELNLGSILPGRTAIAAARNYHFRKLLAEQLRSEKNLHGLEHWFNRVVNGIEESIPELPAADLLDDDCVKAAAPRVLYRRFANNELGPGFWGGSQIVALAGGAENNYSSYRQNDAPLLVFTKTWIDKLSEGLAPREATELLLGNNGDILNLVTTPGKTQLERCAVVLDMVEGESLWEFTERNWRTQILDALRTAAEAMTLRYEQLIAPADPVLIGHSSHGIASVRGQVSSDTIEHVVASLLHLVGNTERTVAVCHPVVADFLHGRSNYGSWTEPIKLMEVPETDMLETAVALWEPRNRYSAYENLESALEAAKAL